MTVIAISGICHAFEPACVGTKVLRRLEFLRLLRGAVEAFTFPENGQGFIAMPEACELVSSGDIDRLQLKASDYIAREWRGEVQLFAARAASVTPTFCAAIVYTARAYCDDPQVGYDERNALVVAGATHVLVAVLGSLGPKPTLSSARFVRNLAGGNLSFEEGAKTYGALVEEAKQIVSYESQWITVAD